MTLHFAVRELMLLSAALFAYRAARLITADHGTVALRHAEHLWAWQRSILGPLNEQHLQGLALVLPGVVKFANLYYATVHFPATAALLIALVGAGRAGLYSRARTALVVATALGLMLHLSYPLAPPRMLHGFVDTAQTYGPSVYSTDTGGLVNQFAAMPSLHVGWAVIVALTMGRLRSRVMQLAGAAHLVITVFAVVVTANHFWSDVIAGAAVAVLGWVLPLLQRLTVRLARPTGWSGKQRPNRYATAVSRLPRTVTNARRAYGPRPLSASVLSAGTSPRSDSAAPTTLQRGLQDEGASDG